MRIVSLVPSVTETLFELGLDEEIVAVTRFCRLPADKVRTRPKIGGTKSPSLQKVLELKPDIVIMDCDENRKQDADFLQQQGVRVFARLPKTVEDSIQLIEELGSLFDRREEAGRICTEIRSRIRQMTVKARFRSLILIWQNPYMTVNFDTYVDSICSLFGFDNVFRQNQERYPRITDDEIVKADPDLLLFPDEPFPFRPRHREQFCLKFPGLLAVRANRILSFDGSYTTWHGVGMLRALREFPDALHKAGLWL